MDVEAVRLCESVVKIEYSETRRRTNTKTKAFEDGVFTEELVCSEE